MKSPKTRLFRLQRSARGAQRRCGVKEMSTDTTGSRTQPSYVPTARDRPGGPCRRRARARAAVVACAHPTRPRHPSRLPCGLCNVRPAASTYLLTSGLPLLASLGRVSPQYPTPTPPEYKTNTPLPYQERHPPTPPAVLRLPAAQCRPVGPRPATVDRPWLWAGVPAGLNGRERLVHSNFPYVIFAFIPSVPSR